MGQWLSDTRLWISDWFDLFTSDQKQTVQTMQQNALWKHWLVDPWESESMANRIPGVQLTHRISGSSADEHNCLHTCWALNWERGYLAPLGQRPTSLSSGLSTMCATTTVTTNSLCSVAAKPLLSVCLPACFITIHLPTSWKAFIFSPDKNLTSLHLFPPGYPQLKPPWIRSHNMRGARSTWVPCKQINLPSIRVARMLPWEWRCCTIDTVEAKKFKILVDTEIKSSS